ncbi:hypothetical protein BDW66DRAFT_165992 [Aspergillus desertorum]
MTTLNNTGNSPLQTPGFGSIPLNFELPPNARFAHGLVDYRHSPRLTKREMAMIRLIQSITEQAGWDRALLQPDKVQLMEWYREAAEGPEGFLISAAAWNWCVEELRDKAKKWQETGRLLVFDSSSAVCQADVSLLVGSAEDIRTQVGRLGSQKRHDSPLVDPFLFPLIYGRTPVLVAGGQVGLQNLWGSVGEIARELPVHPFDELRRRPIDLSRHAGSGGGQESCYSNSFQWLPCEVEFASNGDMPNMRITSYVNNLHPHHHQALYAHLERLISCSVPSWNDVLFYSNTRGCRPPRILTYGCHIHDYQQKHEIFRDLYPLRRWEALCSTYKEWENIRAAAFEYITGPEPPKWKQAKPLPLCAVNLLEELKPEHWDNPVEINRLARYKRARLAWFDHPEPGVSFTYEQWRQGQFTGRALLPQRIGQFPDPLHHEHIPICLQQKFQQEGLQVVVEISQIGLTQDDPTFAGDIDFHTEGLRNDRIVATSLYAVEAKNITQPRISFEHEDKIHAGELECKVPEALATVLDVDDWKLLKERPLRALHEFGSIPITEGQLLTWPNTFRSKQEPFCLEDPGQPGNLTLIKLRLVDPHYRICSTRNVPPQQHEWWAAAARRAANLDSRLPPELVELVMKQTGWWPISTAEARLVREKIRMDHERARRAIDECVGHHIVVFLPYDGYMAQDATVTTQGVYESP